MPRRKAINPAIPDKIYFTQENYAQLALIVRSSLTERAVFGEKSRIVNEALAHFFSPDYKEFQEWKTKKQSPASVI